VIDWEGARIFTQEACAEIFDYTGCRLQPRISGVTVNHATAADPGREAFDFTGSIDLEPPADRIPRHLSSDTGIRNGTVSYDAVLTAHVADWPYLPRRGDFVVAAGKTWKIEAKEEDGGLRPAWYLSRVKT
jgi:hypothetical protein